jgi:hypothetical protein
MPFADVLVTAPPPPPLGAPNSIRIDDAPLGIVIVYVPAAVYDIVVGVKLPDANRMFSMPLTARAESGAR